MANVKPAAGSVGVLLLVLVACKGSKQESAEQAAPSATAVASIPAPEAPAGSAEWKPDPTVAMLETIITGKAKATNVDKSGDTLVISAYEVPGWSLAQHAVRKDNPKAWSIHLEGTACDIKALGSKVTPTGTDGAVSWYSIAGGPLDGLIIKAFEAQKPCIVHVATKEYATARDWKFPG